MADDGERGTVVMAVSDLFFRQKVLESLSASGWRVRPAVSEAKIREAIAAEEPACLVLELETTALDPLTFVSDLKGDDATRKLPILAYAGHTKVDLLRAARAAGCDRVVPRSEVQLRLGAIVDELAGG